MNATQLMQKLKISRTRFYRLKNVGIIPPPQAGVLPRKKYSEGEIAEVVRRLKAVGEIM